MKLELLRFPTSLAMCPYVVTFPCGISYQSVRYEPLRARSSYLHRHIHPRNESLRFIRSRHVVVSLSHEFRALSYPAHRGLDSHPPSDTTCASWHAGYASSPTELFSPLQRKSSPPPAVVANPRDPRLPPTNPPKCRQSNRLVRERRRGERMWISPR